ncbi:type 2 lanthipeptide synthetase LanM family protein [Streptococcus suis]|uniref:Lantibiotic synthetase n=1 Tax=Streptococcus suis TaxID=1307 RepID=A0A0Z8G557_STRSU|nr:type 2 lanthipeptide synthetase LanM family protein [Streptococcus suis]NQF81686.1 type 2 lantipeptide synthetase LanM [Streptococcus suis]NQH53057.1 type 2 lantipeptide synthetase LanM [Streptococcus suis]CYU92351.1 lantibiotic synthetase [Streptococcus suis]CYW00952.1 lantibiotic synthetase [Streptococcus suis]HEL1766757.1 type 2 lantipeptide synthetase LanM family protein [Streptococcus suis]
MKSIDEFKKATYSFERTDYDIDLNKQKISKIRKNYWKKFLGKDFVNYSNYLEITYGIDEDKFNSILEEEKFNYLKTTEIKKWENFLIKMQSDEYMKTNLPDFYVKNNKNEKVKPLFYDFYIPFIKVGRVDLKDSINKFSVSEELINQFTIQLIDKLTNITYRTLILELNIAKEINILEGDSREERYNYFVEKHINDRFWNILDEYPVMFRLMVTTVENWRAATSEFIHHFYSDFEELKEVYSISNIIEKVDLSISDSHNNGKSVIIVQTTNGKIVYKPRNLDLDNKFQNTVTLFNKITNSDLFVYRIVSKADHGWTEYISYNPCKDEKDMEAYYSDLGKLLFILYVLRGNDIHYENIVAHGKHPVLIDLETVFHNKITTPKNMTAAEKIYDMIENSVRRVGILPNIIWGRGGDIGVDVSAMSNGENQEIPVEKASISSILTDEMKIDYKKSILDKKNNIPYFDNMEVDISKFKKNLKAGFVNSYSKFLAKENKDIIVRDIKSYKGLYSRQIIRATQYYSSLIQLSFHPDFLRSGLDREMLFSKLWVQVEEENKLERVSRFELYSMLKNDVPMFLSKVDSLDIKDSSNNIIQCFFNQSAVDLVIKNIRSISNEDFKLQSLLITTALNYDPKYNYIDNKTIKQEKILRISDNKKTGKENNDNYTQISVNIGDYLIDKAFVGDKNDISWMDMNIIGEKTNDWNMVPIGLDLYSGVSGILIFYIYLFKATNNERYLHVVKQCYETIRNYFYKKEKFSDIDEKILFGGFSGETPIIYSLIILEKELGEFFDLNEIESMRHNVFLSCKQNLVKNNDHDIIIGSAGVILILLKYYEVIKKTEILDLAKEYASRIIKDAIVIGDSLAWRGSFAKNPLGGFAHGTSGIIFSLAKLYEYIKEPRYLDVIEKALKYEDFLYRKNVKNWSDNRETEDGVKYDDLDDNIPVAWCHGAGGILLNRILLKKMNTPVSEFRKEKNDFDISMAIETCLKYGLGRSHCLCHGDIGNIEILLLASEVTGDKDIRKKCDIYLEYIKDTLYNKEWKCGIPYKDSPGFMVGLAGIGYGLLKVVNPSLPSILFLE